MLTPADARNFIESLCPSPLVVSNGWGVDSIAMMVGMRQRSIIPDLIQHACTGSEKQDTKDYIASGVFQRWLADNGFPAITDCTYQPKNFKHWPHYHSLEENLLTNMTLPSIAYGGHSCSVKWKIAPMNAWLENWQPAIDCWKRGDKVRKAIGYDAGTRDTKRCSTFQACEDSRDFERFAFIYFLQEWGWTRERCVEEIIAAGLPVPPKSSCYFCTALKPHEVHLLTVSELKRIVIIEARPQGRNAERLAQGLAITEGLWRKAVKGMRGATPKPGSMTQYIREHGLLPSHEIDRLQRETPTHYIFDGQIDDWQTFLEKLENPQ